MSKVLEQEVERALSLRQTVRQASGEVLDLKAYEADMRHLIDTYIQGRGAAKNFGDLGMCLDLIVKVKRHGCGDHQLARTCNKRIAAPWLKLSPIMCGVGLPASTCTILHFTIKCLRC